MDIQYKVLRDGLNEIISANSGTITNSVPIQVLRDLQEKARKTRPKRKPVRKVTKTSK